MGYRYKRTVHCSYCGGAGHNQSGCSAYKERIESLRTEYGDDHYTVRSYDEKKARKASSAKNRKCSYCGEGGHNKAGCSKLKSAMEQFRTKNVEYRKNVLNTLVENGLGPGALIAIDDYWSEDKVVHMIMGVDWEEIHMADKSLDFLKTRKVKNITAIHGGNGRTRLSQSVLGHDETRWGTKYEIVVPTSETNIRKSMPATFLTGTLGLKEVFKRKDYGLHTMKDHWGDFDDEFDIDKFDTELR